MIQPFSGAAAERNKTPIFTRLTTLLTAADRVLEIGAGHGLHARHAVACLPGIDWQASEQPARLAALQQGLAACHELPPPLALDVTGAWPAGPFSAVYAANVAHIMSWPQVTQFVAGSADVLAVGGLLCLYGPFVDSDVVTAASNQAFDARLRALDPVMGLRRVQALAALAQAQGLQPWRDWALPANNRLLVWRKA